MAELEHRVYDRIDDVVRGLKATAADKNDVIKKWRLHENRMESTLEIIVMLLCEDPDEVRMIVAGIVKNSKKLKNPNLLISHIKSSLEAMQRLNRPDYPEELVATDNSHLDPRYNPMTPPATKPHRCASLRKGVHS